MRHMSMRAAAAALAALTALTVMTACAHRAATGAGGLSGTSVDAPISGKPGSSNRPTLLPAPSPVPSSSHHGSGSSTHTSSSTVSSAPPSSAAPQSPPTKVRHSPQLRGNYGISHFAAASCSWRITAGAVTINSLFALVHTGILPPGDVPFTASDNVTGGYWNGTMQQLFWNGQYPVTIGSYGYDDYAGKTVTMTVSIQPTGIDDNASDNTATAVIHVPAAATEAGAPGEHQFTC